MEILSVIIDGLFDRGIITEICCQAFQITSVTLCGCLVFEIILKCFLYLSTSDSSKVVLQVIHCFT